MEKICCTCQKVKPFEDFYKRSTSKDGRQNRCKECTSANNKKHYRNNLKYERARIEANKEKNYEINSLYVVTLKSTTPCADCKIQFPHPAMEFDHLFDKKYNISCMIKSYTLEAIKREIAKCEIVCSNCHRIRTHVRDTRRKYPAVFVP